MVPVCSLMLPAVLTIPPATAMVSTRAPTELVLPAIVHVKRNELEAAGALLATAVGNLMTAGADGVILACTETPVVLDRIAPALAAHCVDATRALAKASVKWWQENQH